MRRPKPLLQLLLARASSSSSFPTRDRAFSLILSPARSIAVGAQTVVPIQTASMAAVSAATAKARAASAPLVAPTTPTPLARRPPSLLLFLRPISTTTTPRSTPRASATKADEQSTEAPPLPPQRHLPELPQLPAPVTLRALQRADVDVSFSRSSGAGGQNVNKVSTKVDMRWDVGSADWVPEEVKGALRHMEKNRFTKENGGGAIIVVSASRHRTQRANLDDALAKLQAMLDAAVEAVTPRESDPEAAKRVAKA